MLKAVRTVSLVVPSTICVSRNIYIDVAQQHDVGWRQLSKLYFNRQKGGAKTIPAAQEWTLMIETVIVICNLKAVKARAV